MRLLGIDPGGKRLGLAVADDLTGIATPLEVVPYSGIGHAAGLIAAAMDTYGTECVVVGLPTTSDGSETPGCARSHALVAALNELGIRTELQPEYLTTNEARRRVRSTGRRSTLPVDDIAAQVILEEYLENRLSRGGSR